MSSNKANQEDRSECEQPLDSRVPSRKKLHSNIVEVDRIEARDENSLADLSQKFDVKFCSQFGLML